MLDSKFYKAMKEIGIDHFRIILIELFPCTCKAELVAREYALTNAIDKKLIYNTQFDGKNEDQVYTGDGNNRFNRGCICHFTQRQGAGFSFSWKKAGKQRSKNFSYPMKRTKEQAYMLCVSMRDKLYPLTNRDYLAELPFAE